MIRRIAFIAYVVVSVSYFAHCESVRILTTGKQQDDVSLNTCLVGHWSQATAWTVANDQLRDLVFLGSCGCVYVIDVSDPSKPEQLSQFNNSQGNTCGFYYDHNNQRLHICSGYLGYRIWDLRDATQPIEIGHYETPGYASSVYVSGQLAFITCADAGLRVLDISDPSTPKELGHFDMTSATYVQVSNTYAYVADLGLRILDIAVPSNPKQVSYHETPGVAFGLHVIGDYAYVADDRGGLRIIDISEPTNPKETGYLLIEGDAWNVQVVGSLAYVSACEEGLRVIDIVDAYNPQEIAYYKTSEAIVNVIASGSHIYMADAANGLQIISMMALGD
jgi:hypothetical protein